MSHCPDAAELWLVCTGVTTAVGYTIMTGATAVDMQQTNCLCSFQIHPTFISRLRSLACGEVICCGSCGGSATSLLRQAAAYRTTVAPRLQVWLLAKTVFSSMDSGYHQLISHFLQTHCCIEPYIIASRRELSAMNPVSFSELPAVPA